MENTPPESTEQASLAPRIRSGLEQQDNHQNSLTFTIHVGNWKGESCSKLQTQSGVVCRGRILNSPKTREFMKMRTCTSKSVEVHHLGRGEKSSLYPDYNVIATLWSFVREHLPLTSTLCSRRGTCDLRLLRMWWWDQDVQSRGGSYQNITLPSFSSTHVSLSHPAVEHEARTSEAGEDHQWGIPTSPRQSPLPAPPSLL